jgi:transcriptional repressor NrdR
VCASLDDKVVDSRQADDGGAIRRRRECLGCGRRFTTFERIEELPLVVVKRSGEREPFELAKLGAGVAAAAKNRMTMEQVDALVAEIEEEARLRGPEVTTQEIGIAVLERLRHLDHVTYLRFASVYKDFEDAEDFEREVVELAKATPPKYH